MAVGFYLNFEKLSVQIIEEEISKMNNDNISDLDDFGFDYINEDNFLNNLYHGSIAATFIVNLYETALNTIVGRRLGWTDEEILKTSHEMKLRLICIMYNVDLADFKSDNSYSIVKSIIRLRNDITHYKNNQVGMGHLLPTDTKIPMGKSKETMATMFTQEYMRKSYDGVVAFLKLLCKKCDLVLNFDCEVIDSDGRDELCEFIVAKETFDMSLGLDSGIDYE